MPTWLKVLLVVFLAIIALIAGGIFVGYHIFQANRGRLVEQGRQLRQEGEAYGHGRDAQACVGESLRRLQSSAAFTNEVRARLFLNGCLSTAAEPPAFCESVPRHSEIAAAAEWTINECRNRDAGEISRCSRLMQEVLQYCDRVKSRNPPSGQTRK